MIEGSKEDIMENKRLMRNIKSDSISNGIYILAIGMADERGLQQDDKGRKEMFTLLRLAKRHFGYQANAPSGNFAHPPRRYMKWR